MDKPKNNDTISVYALQHTQNSRKIVQFALVNNEEVELYLSGNEHDICFTNKRLIIRDKANAADANNKEIYHFYPYSRMIYFSAKTKEKFRAFLTIQINIMDNNQLLLEFHKALPFEEVIQLLSSKILVSR